MIKIISKDFQIKLTSVAGGVVTGQMIYKNQIDTFKTKLQFNSILNSGYFRLGQKNVYLTDFFKKFDIVDCLECGYVKEVL